MGLGKYNALIGVVYITVAQVLKLLLQCHGKGTGIFISFVHSTHHPCTDMKALITWAIIGTSEQMQVS